MSITPVTPIVEMMIGGTWTDITGDVRLNSAHSGGGIKIKRGIPNEGTVAEPTQVDFVLNNAGGKYSPKNELSVNYGKLGRNTPVRFGLSRRLEDFGVPYTDTWGRMPSWTDSENKVHLGDKWRLFGGANRFDVASGAGTIASGTGTSAALFGLYGDCEILVRLKVSARDSEFGIMARMEDPAICDIDFESGLGGMTFGGGTYNTSTAQVHSGTTSSLLTVSGSPTQAYVRTPMKAVTPGIQYRLRMWVRCSVSRNIVPALEWYAEDQVTPVSSNSTTVAVTANTWTLIEWDATAPDGAYYVQAGPTMAGSPTNGTLLFVDDIEVLKNGGVNQFTVYVTPGTTDVVRMGTISPYVTQLNTTANAPANIVAGDWWWMKVQWSGIRRRVRYWKDGTAEPTNWLIRNYNNADATNDHWPKMPKVGMVGVFAKDGTSTISFDSVQVTVWRAHAEIAELPPRWDLSRQDQWVPISARGILRRYGQGRKTLESPAKLYFNSYLGTLKAYAPLESFENDGNIVPSAVSAAPAPRARNLQLGSPQATGTLAMPGIAGFAEFTEADSYLQIRAAPGGTAGKWSHFCFWRVPANPATDEMVYRVTSTGTIREWRIGLNASGALKVEGWAAGATSAAFSQTTGFYPLGSDIAVGQWVAATLYVFDNGAGTVTWALNYNRVGSTTFYTNNSTTSGSAGVCTGAEYLSTAALVTAGNLSVAHSLIYPGDLPFVTSAFYRAASAYNGEECITRWLRLGGNANILCNTTGFSADSKQMGIQTMNKTIDLMEEAAEVDVSFMMEERDLAALNLRTRESLWNQTPVELDIDLGHLTEPLEPTDDDQNTRNYVTVRRTNGGSATSVATDGPLNVNAPETDTDGVGVYDEDVEINYYLDTQLQAAANFRRSKGTQDVVRYPSMKVDLNSEVYDDNPGLVAQILALDTGDLLKVTNREVSAEPTLQIIYGYDEFIDQYDYQITFNTKPADIYTIGVVGKTTRLATRWATNSASFVAGTDVNLKAQFPAGKHLFVQVQDDPDAFPFDVFASGARLRVTSVGDVKNDNPHLRSNITGWFAGTGAMTYVRNLFTGRMKRPVGMMTNNTGTDNWIGAQSYGGVTPGEQYQASAYIKVSVDSDECGVDLYWVDASNSVISNVGGNDATQLVTDDWKHYYVRGTAPVGAVTAFVIPYAHVANGGKMYFVDGRITHVGSMAASPQWLRVEQVPVNGVIKTVGSGEAVTVADPWRVAF